MKKITRLLPYYIMLLFLCTSCNNIAPEKATDWSQYVTLGDYLGVNVELSDTTVTDSQLQTALNELLLPYASLSQVDEPASQGDQVSLRYDILIDGEVAHQVSTTELDLTEESRFQELVQALIGAQAGDQLSVQVTMPDYYGGETYDHVTATFEVEVYAVYHLEYPPLTDELAQQIDGECQTVQDLEDKLLQNLEETGHADAEAQLYRTVWETVVSDCSFESLPQDRVDALYQQSYQVYELEADGTHLSVEEYVADRYNQTLEELEQDLKEQAEQSVKEYAVCHAIATQENLLLTDEEYAQKAQAYVDYYQIESVEMAEELLGKETLYDLFLQEKVLFFLVDHATIA